MRNRCPVYIPSTFSLGLGRLGLVSQLCFFGGGGSLVGASSGDGYCWVLLLLLNGASCFVAEGEFWFLRGGSGVVHSGL